MAERPWFIREIDGSDRADGEPPGLLFPGSFRPLHAGHRLLAEVATQRFGLPITFEISRENVDKPPLDETEIASRLRQFVGYAPVVVTRAAKFADKARLFPGCRFVAGLDTLIRLIDPRYYGNDEFRRDAALEDLLEGGHAFMIAGRTAAGRFLDLSAVDIPPRFRAMFTGLGEAEFRADISSSEIRSHQALAGDETSFRIPPGVSSQAAM